ncbi:hypothetical protein FGG08_000892 [Glutinoglossum americanum]|uniref:C2H2-type domain-containing protein n=1 Tax=Glutinoglossum americanum TaxID=1670608 RepID=A0A9P8I2Y8_9PEZI|nr:hypothetical protein FGG08_000892 [Glutinoglossum americanum]
MAESPVSPLSSLASDDFTPEPHNEEHDHLDTPTTAMPPYKRLKTGPVYDHHVSSPPAIEDDISSDTSDDIPAEAQSTSQAQDEESHPQITVCRWEGCSAGDLGNMDSLVQHIHDDHIGSRQKKYACEWDPCPRKGMPHASGYALRAHMRSHTREKPFYCALPECDRSFTRSDALAKHMRTVHETEALRPSDPVPKHHLNPPKIQRLKLILSSKPPENNSGEEVDAEFDDSATVITSTDVDGAASITHTTNGYDPYPTDLQFTEEENAMSPKELFRLLRRQVHWAEEEHQELETEVAALEEKRKKEWLQKELLLLNTIESEIEWNTRRKAAKKGMTPLPAIEHDKLQLLPKPRMPYTGEPWFRLGEDEPVNHNH